MKAYSLDLRQRVVAAVATGRSRAEVLHIFQISQSIVTRYLKQYRNGNSLAARPHAGGRSLAIHNSHHQALSGLVAADPDATLAQLCDAWAKQTGVRCAYRLRQLQYTADVFVVVDESGYNLDMTSHYGRAPAGVRVYEKTPRNTPPNTS